MTGANRRIVRASVVTLSVSLITGAIAHSAPQFGTTSKPQSTAAPNSVRPPESEPTTLELTPTDAASQEITGTLIMRLATEGEQVQPGTQVAVNMDDPAVKQALRLRGSRYRYGGTSRGGFDCSGFTRYVYSRMGVSLPHSSSGQFQCGTPVSRSSLKSGDLVFFSRSGHSIGHVGIYVGENKFVHAANPGKGVTVDSLGSSYYASRYKGARRVKGK